MGFSIEYHGDETELLVGVLKRAAEGEWVVAVTTVDAAATDYVVREIGAWSAGDVRLTPWDDLRGGPATGDVDVLISSADVTDLLIY